MQSYSFKTSYVTAILSAVVDFYYPSLVKGNNNRKGLLQGQAVQIENFFLSVTKSTYVNQSKKRHKLSVSFQMECIDCIAREQNLWNFHRVVIQTVVSFYQYWLLL